MEKLSNRLRQELSRLSDNPPEGISCYLKADTINRMTATIVGPHGSPYEGGLFVLELEIENSYPFEPPRLKFVTPVYHPNIDTSGRVCMDLLKMPPSGGWKPTIMLENLLVAVQMLLANPNPDDPLMPEIASEFRTNRAEFDKKATESTKQHAQHKEILELH